MVKARFARDPAKYTLAANRKQVSSKPCGLPGKTKYKVRCDKKWTKEHEKPRAAPNGCESRYACGSGASTSDILTPVATGCNSLRRFANVDNGNSHIQHHPEHPAKLLLSQCHPASQRCCVPPIAFNAMVSVLVSRAVHAKS